MNSKTIPNSQLQNKIFRLISFEVGDVVSPFFSYCVNLLSGVWLNTAILHE